MKNALFLAISILRASDGDTETCGRSSGTIEHLQSAGSLSFNLHSIARKVSAAPDIEHRIRPANHCRIGTAVMRQSVFCTAFHFQGGVWQSTDSGIVTGCSAITDDMECAIGWADDGAVGTLKFCAINCALGRAGGTLNRAANCNHFLELNSCKIRIHVQSCLLKINYGATHQLLTAAYT